MKVSNVCLFVNTNPVFYSSTVSKRNLSIKAKIDIHVHKRATLPWKTSTPATRLSDETA